MRVQPLWATRPLTTTVTSRSGAASQACNAAITPADDQTVRAELLEVRCVHLVLFRGLRPRPPAWGRSPQTPMRLRGPALWRLHERQDAPSEPAQRGGERGRGRAPGVQ